MKRKCLAIGISTVSVILLILTSLTNVIGYQMVQSSNQQIVKEEINQRELLFQTIVDIANNKDIQRIILKSQMSRGIFPTTEFPIITKNQIKQMYFLGLILTKVMSKSKIQSMIGEYQFNNQDIRNEISTVIEKETTFNSKITQLKDSECDCENEINQEKISTTDFSDTPIICEISIILIVICIALLAPFSTIENYLHNMYLEHLERLFFLITYPIVFPIAVTALISLYICYHFNCINFGYP